MGERHRLASSMFLNARLRSAEGRMVLYDMVSLCKQEAKVSFRPGLEPDKCHHYVPSSDRKLSR